MKWLLIWFYFALSTSGQGSVEVETYELCREAQRELEAMERGAVSIYTACIQLQGPSRRQELIEEIESHSEELIEKRKELIEKRE